MHRKATFKCVKRACPDVSIHNSQCSKRGGSETCLYRIMPMSRIRRASRARRFRTFVSLHLFYGGNPCGLKPFGLPFHLPTRLADGLGLESDLRLSPLRPCLEHPDFGSPASIDVSQDLGCTQRVSNAVEVVKRATARPDDKAGGIITPQRFPMRIRTCSASNVQPRPQLP